MKIATMALGGVVAGVFVLSTALSAQDDATAVATRIVGNMTTAWNAHDGTAYAAEFWPDAEFINVFGGVMKDRQEIASRTDQIVKGALRGEVWHVIAAQNTRVSSPTF